MQFPQIVGGGVEAIKLAFFKDGITFPLRVEGGFSARDVVSGNITFPEYVRYDCHVGLDDSSPTEGFTFSEYVGGDFTVQFRGSGPLGPFENNTLPRHVGGDFRLYGKITSFRNNICPEYIKGDCDLSGLITAEGFECFPRILGGKLILSRQLKEDEHLQIPEGVEVWWV